MALLGAIRYGRDAFVLGAGGAAIVGTAGFDAVADDAAAAMLAGWGERMDGALERIEIMGNAVDHDFQRFVIFVPAGFAFANSAVLVGAGF